MCHVSTVCDKPDYWYTLKSIFSRYLIVAAYACPYINQDWTACGDTPQADRVLSCLS